LTQKGLGVRLRVGKGGVSWAKAQGPVIEKILCWENEGYGLQERGGSRKRRGEDKGDEGCHMVQEKKFF